MGQNLNKDKKEYDVVTSLFIYSLHIDMIIFSLLVLHEDH